MLVIDPSQNLQSLKISTKPSASLSLSLSLSLYAPFLRVDDANTNYLYVERFMACTCNKGGAIVEAYSARRAKLAIGSSNIWFLGRCDGGFLEGADDGTCTVKFAGQSHGLSGK
jgi:hypothetical protein